MKLNEFQNKVVASPVGEQVAAMVNEQAPGQGTENFRRLISSIGSDLVAAAITAERAGVTLEYICEVTLANCNRIEHEDIHFGN